MPCIHVETNQKITPDAAETMKSEFGKAISLFPGKSEQWLMCVFRGECPMAFRGETSAPMAFVEVKLYGGVDSSASQKMTGEVCRILQWALGIAPSQVYVRYQATDDWGWNGENF